VRIVNAWCERNWFMELRFDRLRALGRQGKVFFHEPAFEAACYPDIVGLVAVLASPYWRRTATSRRPGDLDRFFTEIGKRIHQPDLRPGGAADPIMQWVIDERRLPHDIEILERCRTFVRNWPPQPNNESLNSAETTRPMERLSDVEESQLSALRLPQIK
jgi:hypothetical protein